MWMNSPLGNNSGSLYSVILTLNYVHQGQHYFYALWVVFE